MSSELCLLNRLYEQIHACIRCVDAPGCSMIKDSDRVIRILEKQAFASKVFLIGQALGEHTQRKSGRPYTYKSGKLSHSGQNLDKFLRLFGCSIDSSDPNGYQYAYSSDIVQCYPGKKKSGQGDRKPSVVEVTNCINQSFLLHEIEVLNPRLILLMGKAGRDSFFRYVLRQPQFPPSLSDHINEIVDKQQPPEYRLSDRNIYVLPIQHPSGANPKFKEMTENQKLVDLIRSCCSDK